MATKSKKEKNKINKSKSLFDHVNHIRQTQSKNYYDSLSDDDKKTFNVYMILRILSMDSSIIDEISFLSKYFETMSPKQYYDVLISILPKSRGFHKYIKNSSKQINQTILDCICDKFKVGSKDANDYYTILSGTDSGLNELIDLVKGYGYNEKELKNIFK